MSLSEKFPWLTLICLTNLATCMTRFLISSLAKRKQQPTVQCSSVLRNTTRPSIAKHHRPENILSKWRDKRFYGPNGENITHYDRDTNWFTSYPIYHVI